MDFTLEQDDARIQKAARDLAQKELAAHASDVDREGRLPKENLESLKKQGLLNLRIPSKLGGTGASMQGYLLAIEEIAKACASTAMIMNTQFFASQPLLHYGSEEQKNRYIPRLTSGSYAAMAITEPDAGTDAGSVNASATKSGDLYLLNGIKSFVSCGSIADIIMVLAKTDRSKGQNGMSAFIVEKDFAGVRIEEDEELMGLRGAPVSRIFFEDCRIPAENLLANEGDGFKIAMKAADYGRVGLAAISVGIAQGAADIAVKYACERFQFGKAIKSFQAVQILLADIFAAIHQARLTLYHVGWLIDNGARNFTREAATAKLVASDTAMKVTTEAVQVLGGIGYTKKYPVERMMRDAKVQQIFGGTNQILRVIISNSLTT